MAYAPIDVEARIKGLSDLQKMERRMQALEKEVTRLQTATPKAANAVQKFGRSAKGAVGGVKALSASVKSALGPIGLALSAIGGLSAAFNTLKNQDFAEAKFESLGGDSQQLVTNLQAVSNELQGTASVAELTGAAYDVASAGFSSAAEASLVLKAASLGATGGFSDLNTVANATTSVLNAYGKSAADAGLLVDQFIQTQNDGKIVVAEYAQNIGKVASAAAGLGVPLSEVNAVIAQATASGVQADVAFTGLKGALARLASGEATKALKGTGIEISAASVEADGLFGTLKKLESLDTGQIFKALGTEAGPALLPVIQNLERYEELIKNQESANGTAAAAAATAAGTIEGAWKRVTVAFENLFADQSEFGQVIRATLLMAAATVEALGAAFKLLLAPIRAAIELIAGIASAFTGVQDGEAVLQSLTAAWFDGLQAVQEYSDTIIAVGKVIGDYVGALITQVKGWFADLWGSISQGAQGVIDPIVGAFTQAFTFVKGLIDGFYAGLPQWLKDALGGVGGNIQGALAKVASDIEAARAQVQITVPGSQGSSPASSTSPLPTGGSPLPTGGSRGSGGVATASTKAADEMERQLKAGEDLSRQFSRQIKLLETKDQYDKELLQNQFKFEDQVRRINETAAPLQREGLISQAAVAKNLQDIDTLTEAAKAFGTEMGENAADGIKTLNTELTQSEELVKGAYEIISGTLTDSISGLIDGTKEWGDVLSDIAGQLGKMFLNAGFSALGGGLGIPGFASGGRPPTNEVSMVGERGPELWIPDSPGRVVSNEQSKAALGMYSSGNSASSASNQAPTFKLETTVINGVEYATVDQVEAMGRTATKNGAKQGEARAMNTLKNSRGQRSRLGL